ncbi:MAG: hypothetical protein HY684_04405 [Chloroflexi bacterium]|nr:hypothetical protein [Chloroflexota bacterium]
MDREERSSAAVERELQAFHVSVSNEFRKAERLIGGRLSRDHFVVWAREGVAIAHDSFRSWEAATEYFRVTSEVLDKLPFPHFMTWARLGRSLTQDSPILAAAYFRASSVAVGFLAPSQVSEWAELGRGLYKGTWKSSSLACRFFEQSPRLLRYLTLAELEQFAAFTSALATRSYDMAAECLTLAEGVFSKIDRQDRQGFLTFATTLVEASWRDARAAFESGSKTLARVDKPERARFLSLAQALAQSEPGGALAFFGDCSRALGQTEAGQHGKVLDLAQQLYGIAPAAVPDFVRSTPRVLKQIRFDHLGHWFLEGARILAENPEGGLAYFRLESTKGEEVLESLASGVELQRVREVLRMYCLALAGTNVEISPAQELKVKGIGWAAPERPTTEGNTIYLPAVAERYTTKDENFAWYKVVSTHQAAHLEFGSFAFSFDKESRLFSESRRRALAAQRENGHAPTADLERFFDLFEDRRLAADIFTAVEDTRIDYRVKAEYAGIRGMYRRVQQEALAERLDILALPIREALVEYLVRLSLDAGGEAKAQFPENIAPLLQRMGEIALAVRSLDARVEDTAEATIRLYELVQTVPNQPPAPNEESAGSTGESSGQQQPSSELELPPAEQSTPGDGQGPPRGAGTQQAPERPYTSPRQVEYRGDFKPELVQVLSRLRTSRSQEGQAQGQPLSPQAIQQLLEKSVEFDMDDTAQGDVTASQGLFVNNLLNEAARQHKAQINQEQAKGFGIDKAEEQGDPLHTDEPLTFLYDEWDFRAGDYKPRWCCVRERRMEEGSEDFFRRTLESSSGLVNQIKKSFEMVSPERLRKMRFLMDGEECEMDAVIEARVEQKAGATPNEKIYWRRNKVERDVAVAFLLDMSASTAEAIDESRRPLERWDPPDDPRDYLVWLRARREEVGRRSYKRIIDIERESTVLLIKALETIGDRYGIYGFSGYGRENVEFYVIKDLTEAFSDRVMRRIDKIAPLHATRMGPAIRHATSKLDGQDAKTKILFLISDGRPQDRGYSREGVEKEYAVHDTKMALQEARRQSIVPFCLTVDRSGHDYLKTMCADMGYEVLADIQMLPKRLPFLYRRLTI